MQLLHIVSPLAAYRPLTHDVHVDDPIIDDDDDGHILQFCAKSFDEKRPAIHDVHTLAPISTFITLISISYE